MSHIGIRTECSVGTAGTVGESAVWTYNVDERWDGTSRLAVFVAGHGAGPAAFQQNTSGGLLPMMLARTGRYVCVAIQATSTVAGGRQSVVDAIDAARVAGGTRGTLSAKCALVGYSEGGLGSANYYKQHSDKLACLLTLSGALDLDWAYGTGGHSLVASPDFHTEIDTAYGSYAATAGFRVWDEPTSFRAKGVPWKIGHATDDEVVPTSIATTLLASINDPSVTAWPAYSGGHTAFWDNLPIADVVGFIDSGIW